MRMRKTLIRVVLGALALAAVGGVIGVLFGRGDLGGKVVGTAILAGVAAGLCLPLAKMTANDTTRWAGLFGIAAVIIEFLLILTLIWEMWDIFSHVYDLEEPVAITAGCWAISAMAVVICLWLMRLPAGRVAGLVGLAWTAVGTVIWLVPAWRDFGSYSVENQWWETAGAMLGFGLLLLLNMAGIGEPPTTGRRYAWRWVGVAATLLGLAVALVIIWGDMLDDETWVYPATVAAFLAHANLLLHIPARGGMWWVRLGSSLAMLLTMVLVATLVYFEGRIVDDDMVGRMTGAAAVLAACGTLAVLIHHQMNRSMKKQADSAAALGTDFGKVPMTCPHCQTTLHVPAGDSRCGHCGLHIHIQLREPRCPECDYLLYMFKGSACPECGATLEVSPPAAGPVAS